MALLHSPHYNLLTVYWAIARCEYLKCREALVLWVEAKDAGID